MAGWLPESSQESGWLPAAPAPAAASGSWLPAASSGPTYGSGLTLGAPGQSLQQSLLRYEGSALGQMMREKQNKMLTDLGLDPAITDVEDIPTLDADVQKNENAIARLATLNPDLAEELIRRHQGQPEESKGLFGDMMDTLGDFISPALSLGAKALELLIRPSQIIPELITDAEDDAWYEDIGQALSGKSKAQGDDVIREWFGDETNGWMQGLGGFAIDVIGDPLTWLTFGTAGVGKVVAGEALSAAVAKRTLTEAAETGAFNLADTTFASMDDLINEVVQRASTASRKSIHEDALVAEFSRSIDGLPQSLIDKTIEEINPLLRQMNRTGLGKASPEVIKKWMPYLEKERAALQKKAATLGSGAEKRAVRGQARSLAGAMGGTRFVAGVPFTRLRYVSQAIPGSYGVSPFGPARNFFRGMSGLNRLDKVINKNAVFSSATDFREEVYRTFFDPKLGGWAGLQREYPVMMNELGSRMGIDSVLRPLSEQVGNVTRRLSNHTQYFRNGDIDALYAHSAEFAARGRRDSMLKQVVWSVVDEQTGRPTLQGADMRKSIQDTLDLRNREKVEDYMRFMETLPGFDRTVLDNLDEAVKEGLPASSRVKLEALKERLTPQEIDKLIELKRTQKRVREVYNKNGGELRDRAVDWDSTTSLNHTNADEWIVSQGGRDDVGGRVWQLSVAGPISLNSITDTDLGRGVYGRTVNTTKAPESVVRGKAGPVNFSDADIDDILAKARRGGFTVDTVTKQDAVGGYAVADPRGEFRVSLSDPELRTKVRDYLDTHRELFESDEFHLGGWVPTDDAGNLTDELVLDATRIVKDADEARLYGTAGKQKSIINLDDLEDYVDLANTGARVVTKKPLILGEGNNQEYYDNLVAEVRKQEEARGIDPEMLDVSIDRHLETITRDGVTARLRADGFDAILRKNSEDDWEILSFGPEDIASKEARWNVKSLDDAAPDVRPTQGYAPRIITEEGRTALLRAKYGQIPDSEGAELHLHDLKKSHALRQKLDNVDIVEANNQMKNELGLAGDFFHMDPLEVHARYGQRVAEDMMGTFLQGSARTLTQNRWGVGTAVMVNQYKFRGSTTGSRSLRKMSDQHKKLVEKRAEIVAKVVEKMEKKASKISAEIERLRGELAQYTDDVPAGSTAPRGRVGAAQRRAAGAGSRESAAIGESLEKVRNQIRKKEAALAQAGKNMGKAKEATVMKLAKDLKALRSKEDMLVTLRKRLSEGKTTMSDPATKQAAQEALADAVTTRTTRIAELEGQRQKALLKAEQADAKLGVQLDKIRTRYQTEAARPVPAIVTDAEDIPKDFVRLSEIDPNIAMHPYIAEEFRHALGTKPVNEMRRMWRQFVMGPWKTYSTVYYPGFHARNFMGAWFNSWLGGVGVPHFNDAFRVARAMKGDTKWTTRPVGKEKARLWGLDGFAGKKADEITYEDVGNHLEAMLIRGGNSNIGADAFPSPAEEIRRMKGQTTRRGRMPQAAKTAGKPFVKYGALARRSTETTENFFRTATYLRGLEITGGSPVGARAFTMMRHGDYEDLNDYEEIIKDVVPFYKWMRTNIPFQIKQLLEAPGKTLAAVKSQNVGFAIAGEDIDTAKKNLPPWVRESYALALPGGKKGDEMLKYLSLDLPFSDLFTGANDYMSAFLPMLRPFYEAKVSKGRLGPEGGTIPIKEKVPLSAWAGLPGIRQVLEGWITTGADGKEYIDGDVQHMMSAVPIFSRFKNWIYADESAQERRAATFWSAITGVRPEKISQEEMTAAEKNFYHDELLPLIDGLREMGAPLPETAEIPTEVFEKLGLTVEEDEVVADAGPFGASPFGG